MDSRSSGAAGYSTESGRHSGTTLTDAVRMWPTPDAAVSNDGEQPETFQARREAVKAKHNNGNGMGTPLAMAVKMWPSPVASEARQGFQDRTRGKKGTQESLTTAAVLWATPRASDGEKGGPHMSFGAGGTPLPTQAHQWYERSDQYFIRLGQWKIRHGLDGSSAVVLHPLFVQALMGFPAEWINCALWATPSSPKSRPSRSASSGDA